MTFEQLQRVHQHYVELGTLCDEEGMEEDGWITGAIKSLSQTMDWFLQDIEEEIEEKTGA